MPVNWCSRQEWLPKPCKSGAQRQRSLREKQSHLQPPRSKRGALIIVPREQKGRRKIAESRRSRVVRTTPEHLMDFSIRFLPSKLKWGRRRALACSLCVPCKYCGRAQAPEPHRRNGGSPRIRTVFSPVKSRDFTIKVSN